MSKAEFRKGTAGPGTAVCCLLRPGQEASEAMAACLNHVAARHPAVTFLSIAGAALVGGFPDSRCPSLLAEECGRAACRRKRWNPEEREKARVVWWTLGEQLQTRSQHNGISEPI